MAKIACLGWGSLVWNPKNLPVQRDWFTDGPLINVEFARQSSKSKLITLVLADTPFPVRSLWNIMNVTNLGLAIDCLRERESIPEKNRALHIGRWSRRDPSHRFIPALAEWATLLGLDHVIWTNLPPRIDGVEVLPQSHQVIEYLKNLAGEIKNQAEHYVRSAPAQIDTPYRRDIEKSLNWTPTSNYNGRKGRAQNL
jgi:hypothetical protein